MDKMLHGTESFFLRIPPEGDPGSGADTRSISTHQIKLTGLVTQRSKEGPRCFARARAEVTLELSYTLPKTIDDDKSHDVYLVAWVSTMKCRLYCL